MQNVALIIGALFLLLITFYVGKKFESWKYLIMSRNKPRLSGVADKFPGLSSEQMIEQALAAERLGNWQEAVERFIVAKHKNLAYRGLLFRAGKLCYDHGAFDNANKLFEHTIAFGESVDTANYLRGLIAVGRNDLAAAERFFEAAANAEPFKPGYYFYWAEALRKDHHPKEAIRRYEQAAACTSSEQDATVCKFKVRMARLEAAETPELNAEIEKKRNAGPLSVDWLLTDAALKIRQGNIAEALQLIDKARTADENRLFSLFASCTGDMLFSEACRNHPEVARACRVANTSSLTVP
jgi:tetratricopeptide (TPR) repeat protein